MKFDAAIIEPLARLLEAHPELGIKSPSEAAKRAIVQFTNELRRQAGEAGPGPPASNLVEELFEILQRHARRELSPKRKS